MKILFKKIKKIKKKIVRKHIYSTMTDWNPAEIIGTNPKPWHSHFINTLLLMKIGLRKKRNGLQI